jgi:hypothetical protein
LEHFAHYIKVPAAEAVKLNSTQIPQPAVTSSDQQVLATLMELLLLELLVFSHTLAPQPAHGSRPP